MSDTIDNQTEQQYNQPQPDNSGDLERRYTELQEKYIGALSSGNQEEIEKAEREVKIFLGDAKPDSEEAPSATGRPETPPADNTIQPPDAEAKTEVISKEGTDESPGAKDGANSPSGSTEDWLNSLTPDVRKLVEERLEQERKAREYHEQRYRSVVGREPTFQKKYAEEKKLREELEQKLRDGAVSQPSNPTATPANTQTATAKKIQELNEKIAKLRGPDPELADLLETTRDALLETQQLMASSVPKVDMSAVEELKVKLAEQEEARLVEQSRFELERQMPGALDFIDYVDPKTKWSPWQQFLQEMPEHLQRWYQADPFSPSVHKELLKNYYPEWASQYNAAHGYVQQQQPTQQPSQPEVDPRAAQVQQARQARLTTSAAQPARSAPPPQQKLSLEERRKNPPPYGSPEYEALVAEVIKATQEGKL